MPRRVQDIVPNTHRSIRDIPVDRRSIIAPIQPPKKKSGRTLLLRKSDVETVNDAEETERVESPKVRAVKNALEMRSNSPIMTPRALKKSGGKRWLLIFMGIVVIVAAAGYVASVYFSRATFTIVPKTIPFSVNSTYLSQNTPGKGVLAYDLATIKGDLSATVAATDGPQLSTSAKGKITIYNSYSIQTQRLIAGTRFVDERGRIYRLASSVVIPGYVSSNAKITPGSVSVSITADQPGQSYNISKSDPISDFKIMAYKDSAKYDTIYGRIASDVSGGFVGAKKTIDPAALASTTSELKTKIVDALLIKLKSSIPAGYIMYPKAYVSTFSSPTIGGSDPKSASVTLQGTVYGILFKRDELVARVAGDQTVAFFDGFSYETPGLESLDFSIANAKDFSPEKKNTLIIKLKGNAMLVGSIPVDTLKTKLAGLSLAETSTVFRSFKPVIEIEKSSGSITPPWSRVPNDLDRITIEVQAASVRAEP